MKTLELSRDILQKELVTDQTAAKAFGLFAFIILTSLGAYVRMPLPFTPVPITLQTFFVLLSGAVLGRKWGAASQAGYLIFGLVGLPIFAGANSGIAYLFGPSGGYIFGFIISSWLVGKMLKQQRQNKINQIVLAMSVSSFLGIYAFGLLGLSIFLQCNLSKTLALGLFPFLLGDALKIICASFIFYRIERRCNEIFGLS